jgi:hypothetical protein
MTRLSVSNALALEEEEGTIVRIPSMHRDSQPKVRVDGAVHAYNKRAQREHRKEVRNAKRNTR